MDDVEYYISCSNILFINSHINIYFMATHNTFTILHAHKCMSSLSPTKIFFPRSNNKCRLTATKKYYINKNFLEYKKKRKKIAILFFPQNSCWLSVSPQHFAMLKQFTQHSTTYTERNLSYIEFLSGSLTQFLLFFYTFATATK